MTAQQPAAQNEIERAWAYHTEADQLLHSRVEAFLLAQAFLIVCAVMIITSQWRDYLEYAVLLTVLTVLGITVSIHLINLNRRIVEGIDFLKETYLLRDPIYRAYLDKLGEDISVKRLLPIRLPKAFLVFWYAMIGYCTFYAFKFVWSVMNAKSVLDVILKVN